MTRLPVPDGRPWAAAARTGGVAAALALALCAPPLRAQIPLEEALAAVGFMTGCWAEETPGAGLREYYTPAAPNMMTGLSRFLQDGLVVDWEFHRIDAGPSGPTLTPHPRGVASVTFSPASSTENRIVWENLDHDFPQRIIYERTGPDHLVVRIEGGQGAQARAMTWRMRRASCIEPG